MRATWLARGLALPAIVLAAACASGGRQPANTTTVLVRVENDAPPAEPVTIWVAPTNNGARRSLGTVTPSTTQLLRVEQLDGTAEYRLTAERASGASVSSQPFRPGATELVDWRLSTNVLQLLQAVRP